MTAQLTIAGITIKTDEAGRYCLNDFHKAAGGAPKHTPGRFTCTETFMDLCEELSRNPDECPVNSKPGRGGGTYVVRELVYAYAIWISPKFHLEVIRAYDTLATQGVAVHKNAAEDLLANPLKYIEALMGQARALQEANLRLMQETAEKSQQIEHLSS